MSIKREYQPLHPYLAGKNGCTDCGLPAERHMPQGLEWLRKNYPAAYEALPEPYKNDSCLEFYLDVNGDLCAKPVPGQEVALGDKEWVFVHFGVLSLIVEPRHWWVECDKDWRERKEDTA